MVEMSKSKQANVCANKVPSIIVPSKHGYNGLRPGCLTRKYYLAETKNKESTQDEVNDSNVFK